jgi:hypothetical protein
MNEWIIWMNEEVALPVHSLCQLSSPQYPRRFTGSSTLIAYSSPCRRFLGISGNDTGRPLNLLYGSLWGSLWTVSDCE